jgi:hypothetical protein
LDEAQRAFELGAVDFRTIKGPTRLGMGDCQGRNCWPAMASLLAVQSGRRPSAIGPSSVRPPIVPILLGDLMEASAGMAAGPGRDSDTNDGARGG